MTDGVIGKPAWRRDFQLKMESVMNVCSLFANKKTDGTYNNFVTKCGEEKNQGAIPKESPFALCYLMQNYYNLGLRYFLFPRAEIRRVSVIYPSADHHHHYYHLEIIWSFATETKSLGQRPTSQRTFLLEKLFLYFKTKQKGKAGQTAEYIFDSPISL